MSQGRDSVSDSVRSEHRDPAVFPSIHVLYLLFLLLLPAPPQDLEQEEYSLHWPHLASLGHSSTPSCPAQCLSICIISEPSTHCGFDGSDSLCILLLTLVPYTGLLGS